MLAPFFTLFENYVFVCGVLRLGFGLGSWLSLSLSSQLRAQPQPASSSCIVHNYLLDWFHSCMHKYLCLDLFPNMIY